MIKKLETRNHSNNVRLISGFSGDAVKERVDVLSSRSKRGYYITVYSGMVMSSVVALILKYVKS